MKEEVRIPPVGESIVEGMLMTWFRHAGDIVRIDEDLYEFETEKASVIVPSPFSGMLEIIVGEGTRVTIGQLVATIDTDKAASDEGVAVSATKEPGADDIPPAAIADDNGAPLLSPAVRRVVTEQGIDVARIRGTGKGGRITKEDIMEKGGVEKTEKPAPPAVTAGTGGRPLARTPLSPVRKAIAKHLLASRHEAAHLTTFNEINMEELQRIRSEHQESFTKRHGIKLGIMSFFIRATVDALKEYPVINSRIEGDDVIRYDFYDIGVAVSTDRGLVVPIIRNADTLSLADIEKKIADLSERARTKKILLPELQGGTFSITNGGIYGSLMSTPIPNYPQSAVLGLHAIKDRPVAAEGIVVIKPMMYVALTYDHRLIDGREAVSFLVRVKQYIEDPEEMLLDG